MQRSKRSSSAKARSRVGLSSSPSSRVNSRSSSPMSSLSSHMMTSSSSSSSSSRSLSTSSSHVSRRTISSTSTKQHAPSAVASRRAFSASSASSSDNTARMTSIQEARDVLNHFGIQEDHPGILVGTKSIRGTGKSFPITNPTTGEKVISVNFASDEDYHKIIPQLDSERARWATTPAPLRGEIVRQIGDSLRVEKENLAKIISFEMGKIYTESLGEVQEAIDICDFAVGLSRQVGGTVFPSERKDHMMTERWLPLTGNVGIITAFNFPSAVFFWNSALSLVCGNTQVLKPAPTGSLIALACSKLVGDVLAKHGFESINALFLGDSDVGKALVEDKKTSLVSFTGSTHVGRQVAVSVAERFGKHILELGGNNAMFVFPDADLNMAVRSALFAAVGTCGQRCTSLRRLYIHEDVYDQMLDMLQSSYKGVSIGDPMDPKTLCGPLHSEAAVKAFEDAVAKVPTQHGKVIYGGNRLTDRKGNFVVPAIAEMPTDAALVKEELFAPLLYVMKFKTLSEAIALNNDVEQGLSSAIFTKNQAAVYHWTGPSGSDCGIANVNIGTSGAEIGGAFGGEKATGGGRESGSDAWKGYMRRQTSTVNYSRELPLAQGVNFDVGSSAAYTPPASHPAFDM